MKDSLCVTVWLRPQPEPAELRSAGRGGGEQHQGGPGQQGLLGGQVQAARRSHGEERQRGIE